ncbi:pantoate--beta-alanine ligase [Ornithinibacillus sp. BX22]|uniref:Pantothenate synthetase n=1 Tax=Ornithinibacillus hominis TaxID=2763055 RepID=A0A923L720_9BACI|nr:pantoate--beta-alanine ligase [Ornithinibacillus hominis]MBC5637555.1 pantoate--beta-alanine ligase [Ornithinibacillus hominis]
MNIAKTIKETRQIVQQWKNENLTIGFVPTMGYLHEGHASLIRRAAEENDRVVVSVFVNPIQFGPSEDLDKYPRDIEMDKRICEANGAHLIFVPGVDELYPFGFSTYVDVEGPSKGLCGGSRPGHFRGVCTVVAKLFHIVQPDSAFFGMKDAQQLAVIRRMTEDLCFPVRIVGCPIVRESDGLALSSRNNYLNDVERKAALCLSQGLDEGLRLIENGERNTHVIKSAVRKKIEQEPLARVDYVEAVDPNTIQGIDYIKESILCAVAVFIGNTRLIDNFIWEEA